MNYLASKSEFAIDFFNGGGGLLGSASIDLVAAGLFTPNGLAFNYKKYSVGGTAPLGTATVRARVSMIDGLSNPQGGGQAFVVDDFTLTVGDGEEVPEPASGLLLGAGVAAVALLRRRHKSKKAGFAPSGAKPA